MQPDKNPAKKSDLTEDEFVSRLIPDPPRIPETKLFLGWLGKSGTAERWRLYLTPTLDHYLEVNAGDIVHTHKMTNDLFPLGGTLLWVKRKAEVTRTRTTSARAQAGFLSGGITSRLFPGPNAAGRFPLIAPGGPEEIIWTLLVTTTFFLLAGITQISAITDCFPDPDSGAGCSTSLSHCC